MSGGSLIILSLNFRWVKFAKDLIFPESTSIFKTYMSIIIKLSLMKVNTFAN